MVRGERYSRDEWLVLLHYFLSQPEPAHTDSHPSLIQFAAQIGRSPGSVDASLRNIKMAVTGAAGFEHGARTMRVVVAEFANDPNGLAETAAEAPSRIRRRQRR